MCLCPGALARAGGSEEAEQWREEFASLNTVGRPGGACWVSLSQSWWRGWAAPRCTAAPWRLPSALQSPLREPWCPMGLGVQLFYPGTHSPPAWCPFPRRGPAVSGRGQCGAPGALGDEGPMTAAAGGGAGRSAVGGTGPAGGRWQWSTEASAVDPAASPAAAAWRCGGVVAPGEGGRRAVGCPLRPQAVLTHFL